LSYPRAKNEGGGIAISRVAGRRGWATVVDESVLAVAGQQATKLAMLMSAMLMRVRELIECGKQAMPRKWAGIEVLWKGGVGLGLAGSPYRLARAVGGSQFYPSRDRQI
jgi:hypothetical protein